MRRNRRDPLVAMSFLAIEPLFLKAGDNQGLGFTGQNLILHRMRQSCQRRFEVKLGSYLGEVLQ